jgi:Zn-dependent peptidase ImmA (M78 family)
LPSRVSGLFVFTEELGGCIAIQRKHPPGRRLWSLCHEFAHFLVHRYEAEVTVLRTDRRSSRKERFADHLAKAFLMPASSLRRRFHDLLRTAGQVTPASLLDLAELYGVSFEALLLRTEDLRLLPVGTWLRLKESKFHVREAKQLLGIRPGFEEPVLPRRYVKLAVQAYEDEKLTEGELTEILHTDRQRARQMVEEVKSQTEVTLEGETGQLELDLGETLVGIRSAG